VGPIWRGGNANEPALLSSSYLESLRLAADRKLESVAFPSISTGAYGYPVGEAAPIAIGAVVKFLKEENTTILRVVFVLFNRETYDAYSSVLDGESNRG
jgi:O-acetyl-ADP-ribose deacetylase (regulator of RNase III)